MANSQALDALGFSSHTGINALAIDYRYRRLSDYFHGTSCLEMGSSDGRGLSCLLNHFESVVAVDGSGEAIARIRQDFPNVEAVHSMFENLDLGRRFDTVLMGHVLEHVEDPMLVLEVGKRHLALGGALIADVPNGNSLHRHLGVELGMLTRCNDLNESDISIGHRRVYMPDEFYGQLERAGLRVAARGGFFLKPFSNSQLESLLPGQLEALFKLGEGFPEIAAEMYAVCET